MVLIFRGKFFVSIIVMILCLGLTVQTIDSNRKHQTNKDFIQRLINLNNYFLTLSSNDYLFGSRKLTGENGSTKRKERIQKKGHIW